MRKAISTVIASILMLMIVVGLAGTTYLFISGTFTSKTATTFEVIDAINDSVIIRNSGTDSITSVKATLDGSNVKIAVIPNTNPITNGLVAYWKMNEGSGSTTTDNSGNGNIGNLLPSCPDCPSWDNGVEGKALKFDGSNDYVNCGNSPTLRPATSISVSAWIKPDVTKPDQFIVAYGNTGFKGWMFHYTLDSMRWWIRNGVSYAAASFTLSPSTGVWYHIVGTYENPTLKLYVNGDQKSTATITGPIDYTGLTACYIGQSESLVPGRYFNGVIDKVSIYNRALSDSEIKTLASGLVTPGQLASVKPLTELSEGTHTLRLCTSSMCNTAILTIT